MLPSKISILWTVLSFDLQNHLNEMYRETETSRIILHGEFYWNNAKANNKRMPECVVYLAYFPTSQVVSDTRPINWLGEMWPECRYRIEEIVYQYSNEHLKLKSKQNKVTKYVIISYHTEKNSGSNNYFVWCIEGDTHKPPVVWIKRYFWSFRWQHIA